MICYHEEDSERGKYIGWRIYFIVVQYHIWIIAIQRIYICASCQYSIMEHCVGCL